MRNPVTRLGALLRETRGELAKVSWSSRRDIIGATGVVLVSVGVLAVFIGLTDWILSRLITLVVR